MEKLRQRNQDLLKIRDQIDELNPAHNESVLEGGEKSLQTSPVKLRPDTKKISKPDTPMASVQDFDSNLEH